MLELFYLRFHAEAKDMDATTGKDPFDLLMNAGSSPDLWVLVGGPSLLLVIIILAYAIAVALRNRRERAELARAVEAEALHPGGDRGDLGASAAPSEDDEASAPYEVPADLESVPLEEEEEATGKPQLRIVAPEPVPEAAEGASEVEEVRQTDRTSWLRRLRAGLTKTRDGLRASVGALFAGKVRIDQDLLERLHEALYRADIGVATADKLVEHVRATLGKADGADWETVGKALKEQACTLLAAPQAAPLQRPEAAPWVILIVGVNGVGKTTTIGKLGANFLADDQTVLLGAGDTFRAAAIEQLSVWADRLGVEVVKHKAGADPAAVAYDAVKAAVARQTDVLLIDTAGRLHAKAELMAELGKINRVIGKDLPGAPHETWLVIDATTGQNAVAQVKAFSEVVKLTGLIVTKLDGTAKGGVLLGIVDQFKLPVRYVGVGEKAADLRAFDPNDYVDSLF
jgi:fused signal recognition particle receptor